MTSPFLMTRIIFNQNKAYKMQSNCFYKPFEDIKLPFDILHLRRVQEFSDDKWMLLIERQNHFGK